MAKKPHTIEQKPEEVEIHPDAWERFQKAVDKVAPPRRTPRDEKEDAADDHLYTSHFHPPPK